MHHKGRSHPYEPTFLGEMHKQLEQHDCTNNVYIITVKLMTNSLHSRIKLRNTKCWFHVSSPVLLTKNHEYNHNRWQRPTHKMQHRNQTYMCDSKQPTQYNIMHAKHGCNQHSTASQMQQTQQYGKHKWKQPR